MGYRIIYGEEKNQQRKGQGFRILMMTLGFFFLFFQVVSRFWPEGMELMQLLLPLEEVEQTFQAVEVFSQELGSGFSLKDAATNFCSTLLEYGRTY